VAKENAQSKKIATLERTARAYRRGLAKDAPAAKEPQRRRARLDGSSDLVNLLTTSAGVFDIFAASGSRPLPKEAVIDVAMGGASEVVMEGTYELDRLIGASPAPASVLDIMTASGSLTKEASADYREATGEVALESSEEAFEEASISDCCDCCCDCEEASTATAGAEDSTDEGLPIANHLYEGSLMDQSPSASFLGDNQGCPVAQDGTSSTRPRKAYLSPALIWLEEEGLPTAEMEAKALGGDMDKEAVMRRATEKWRRMSVEEKAVWRARAKVDAKEVRAKEDAKEAKAKEEANTNQK